VLTYVAKGGAKTPTVRNALAGRFKTGLFSLPSVCKGAREYPEVAQRWHSENGGESGEAWYLNAVNPILSPAPCKALASMHSENENNLCTLGPLYQAPAAEDSQGN
jgi:hypothetical protein